MPAAPITGALNIIAAALRQDYPGITIVVADPRRPYQSGLMIYAKSWEQTELSNYWLEVQTYWNGSSDTIIDMAHWLRRNDYRIINEVKGEAQAHPQNANWLIVSQTFKVLIDATSGRPAPTLPPERSQGPAITGLTIHIKNKADRLLETLTYSVQG